MSSSSVFHPGLTFATLVVQFAVARGGAIPIVAPRRKGGSEPEDPDEHSTSSTGNGGSTSSKPTSSSATVSKTSSSSVSIPTTPPPSSSSTASATNSSTSGATSSSTSSLSSPSAVILPSTSPIRSDITTAGIVGVVIGSVAIIGLAVMLISKCIRRARNAKERTKGSKFFRVGSSSPVRPQTPVTEMSQTHSSPLISSAVAAGLTSHPILSRYSHSISTNTTASLSPLFPVASLQHTHTRSDAGASDGSPNSTHGHGSGPHTDSTHDSLSYMSSIAGSGSVGLGLLPIITAAAAANAPPPAVYSPEESGLHRALTLHQKSLEEDTKGQDVGHIDTEKGDDVVNDPPPRYDA